MEDIEKLLKEEDSLLKDDDKDEIKSTNDDEPIIDEKSENDLLKGLDDDIQNTEVNSEFEEILSSIQNGETSNLKIDDKEDDEKKEEPSKTAELTREDTNELLLELCESPTTIQDEQLSSDTGSNQEDSNEEESSESDKNKDEEDEQKDIQDVPEVQNEQPKDETEKQTKDDIVNLEEPSSPESSLKIDESEQNTQETIESDQNDQIEVQSSNEEVDFKVPDSKITDDDDEKMDVDDNSECLTASESRETIQSAETIDSSSQEDIKEEEKPKDIVCETVKKEEIKVKLNFMRKFASSVGKLSRSDLEELLLEKITESIVFRSESTELRTKCEKQDEIIDNLKQRIQSITKQYNDLDMIHKRIVKDLKEKPDQPITPVKITRAVGLQVYQPHNNNNSNNLKPKVTSTTQKLTVKRPNESDLNEKEADAKRKKSSKIITPMRPPLSEKQKASLEQQEATIEQKIRTKVIKPDAVSLPSSISTKPTANGMTKIPRYNIIYYFVS